MRKISLSGCTVLLAATLHAGPAWAQEQSPPANVNSADAASPGAGGDIVITALRQETTLNQTPLAITAVRGRDLLSAGIKDARDLSAVVPNFYLTQDSYDARIAIRGVTSSDVSEKGDTSVAFLLDGIYIARPADTMGSFFDLERVEVLRGPQGTLYGRNTTAGVVNVISARPTNKFEASFDGRAGNLGMVGGTAVVNVPVGDTLGLRAAVNYDRENSFLRKGVPSDIPISPGRNEISTRLSFGGKIGDRFDFVIRGDYSHAGGYESGFVQTSDVFDLNVPVGTNPQLRDLSSRDLRTLRYAQQYSTLRNDNRYGVMADATYHLGGIDLTYLGSYRYTSRDDDRNMRVSASYNTPSNSSGSFNSWSHELRLAFGSDKPLSGQVGLYYFRERSAVTWTLGNPFAAAVGGPNAVGYNLITDPFISKSQAAFSQLTYRVTDALRLTGGIRYTKDDRSRSGGVYFDIRDPVTGVVTRTLSGAYLADRSFEKATWKAGVDYDLRDLGLLYFNVATGYKSGGFNDGCVAGAGVGCAITADTLYYNPETVTSYEGGFKFNLFDRALAWNLSAFHYDYKGLQLSQFATNAVGGPTRLTQNAGSAKVDGIETDVRISPLRNGTFTLAAAYTYARYDEFVPRLASGASRDFHGLLLDHAPKWSGSVSYEHHFPLANGGDISPRILSNFSSPYYIAGVTTLAQYRNPSYTKTDVSLRYGAPGGRWYIQAFARNLEDTVTISHAGSGAFANTTLSEPRTFGVRFGVKY